MARYLTGIIWLDAVVGLLSGFLAAFILYAVCGILIQSIYGLPSHRPQMLAISFIAALLTFGACVLIGRKYTLFAVAMWLGGLPFSLLMICLAWWIS